LEDDEGGERRWSDIIESRLMLLLEDGEVEFGSNTELDGRDGGTGAEKK
jgi:hypothetical protein